MTDQPGEHVSQHPMGARVQELFGDAAALSLSGGGQWARLCIDVTRDQWRESATTLRDDPELELTFFDWLSGVDETREPPHDFAIVAHLWSVTRRSGVLLRTAVPAAEPVLASLIPVFAGAAWHERETFEMFGVSFSGHADLRKLLLADEFTGNPLRKDFLLASRIIKDWPGSKEPGQSDGASTRRKMLPPGVPQPGQWGEAR